MDVLINNDNKTALKKRIPWIDSTKEYLYYWT